MDALRLDHGEIEVDTGADTFADAAAFLHLLRDGLRDDIARRELHALRIVFLHEALAVFVLELRALGAAGLGEQHAVDRKARRMELHHLRILERDADVHAGHDAVARGTVRIRSADPIGTAIAARRDEHALGRNAEDVARAHIERDDAIELLFILTAHADFEHLALGDEIDVLLEALLKQRMHHRVPRAVHVVGRARLRGTAHLALMEVAFLVAVVRIAHVVHLTDRLARLLSEELHSILIVQPCAALDGIVGMQIRRILDIRADTRDAVHAALRHRRGRARRRKLRHDTHLQVLILRHGSQGRAHPCAAAADDQHIVGHVAAPYRCRDIVSLPDKHPARAQHDAGGRRADDKLAACNLFGHSQTLLIRIHFHHPMKRTISKLT